MNGDTEELKKVPKIAAMINFNKTGIDKCSVF